MNTENTYLLFVHYGITAQDNVSEMIEKVSGICYLDFCRRVFFQSNTPVEKRTELQRETDALLSNRIPKLLQSANDAVNGMETFDKLHHEICEDIRKVFKDTGSQTYGIAQRWLNLVLMHLAVIESGFTSGKLPIEGTRKYFHVPVDQNTLEVATSRSGRFLHGLKLKCAPLYHDKEEPYQMGWYRPGETQPSEQWEYPEYMEFQIAVREKIAETGASQENHYSDALDWVFRACMERNRIRLYPRRKV